MQPEECKSWPEVWNTWIHRCTINQNLSVKQTCKRNYKKGVNFKGLYSRVSASQISKVGKQNFVEKDFSSYMALPYNTTTNLDNSGGSEFI